MNLTQITHNDLDGYGASTVVADIVRVDRVEHVTRYADVEAVVDAEVGRFGQLDAPGTLLVTDIAVERGFAGLIRDFSDMNAARARPHTLIVLDHHASSLESLGRAGLVRVTRHGIEAFAPPGRDGDDATVTVVVDTTRSATRLCADMAFLIAACGEPAGDRASPRTMAALVEAVDAVDLWRRERSSFDAGEALNEMFWEVVLTYVPPGHEDHDAFVSGILLDAAELVAKGEPADAVEAAGMRLRRDAVDRLVAASGIAETDRQRAMTSRMRVSRLLARSGRLFVEPFADLRAKVCHGMDPGILQRTADFMLEDGGTDIVVNVMRGGAMSFRSLDGQALELASRFGGGGHPNAAGARLGTDAVFSLSEAVALMRAVLDGGVAAAPHTWNA